MKIVKTPLTLGSREREEWLEAFSRFGKPETVFFMDIETKGFSRSYDSVYLVGYLYFDNGGFYIEQHLASDRRDEPAVVESYLERLEDAETLITFNGEMFDLPFMENRRRLLHLDGRMPAAASVDLYRRYRPFARLFEWENCRLKTIERFLGIDREDVFSGGELIEVYEEYARTQDPALEKTLLLHNYEDILNMPRLLRIDSYLQALETAPVEDLVPEGESARGLRFRVILANPLSISFEGDVPYCRSIAETVHFRTEARSPVLFLTLPVRNGVYYHYLPHPEDYYYLPESDAIIHNSLADTLGPVRKKKATSKNCRIARDGRFLILKEVPEGLHAFRGEKKEPIAYCEVEELLQFLPAADREWKSRLFHSILPI